MKKEVFYCDQCAAQIPKLIGMYEIRDHSSIGIINQDINLIGIHLKDNTDLHFCNEDCMFKYIHQQLEECRIRIYKDGAIIRTLTGDE